MREVAAPSGLGFGMRSDGTAECYVPTGQHGVKSAAWALGRYGEREGGAELLKCIFIGSSIMLRKCHAIYFGVEPIGYCSHSRTH